MLAMDGDLGASVEESSVMGLGCSLGLAPSFLRDQSGQGGATYM